MYERRISGTNVPTLGERYQLKVSPDISNNGCKNSKNLFID